MKNTKEKRIIWSNMNLKLKDWIDDLKEEYPDMEEDEYYDLMIKTNDEYLDDERENLNKSIDGDMLVIADLGLWNGRRSAYKIIKNAKLSNALEVQYDYAEFYVKDGELYGTESHHDGTNFYTFRKIKKSAPKGKLEDILYNLYNNIPVDEKDINAVTSKLGPMVKKVYGWS